MVHLTTHLCSWSTLRDPRRANHGVELALRGTKPRSTEHGARSVPLLFKQFHGARSTEHGDITPWLPPRPLRDHGEVIPCLSTFSLPFPWFSRDTPHSFGQVNCSHVHVTRPNARLSLHKQNERACAAHIRPARDRGGPGARRRCVRRRRGDRGGGLARVRPARGIRAREQRCRCWWRA